MRRGFVGAALLGRRLVMSSPTGPGMGFSLPTTECRSTKKRMEDREAGGEGAQLLGMWTTEVKGRRTGEASKVPDLNNTGSSDLFELHGASSQPAANELRGTGPERGRAPKITYLNTQPR